MISSASPDELQNVTIDPLGVTVDALSEAPLPRQPCHVISSEV